MGNGEERQSAEQQAVLYEQLCRLYPRKEKYLKRWAEALLLLGREIEADGVLLRLQRIYGDQGNRLALDELKQLRHRLYAEAKARSHRQPPIFQHATHGLIAALFSGHRKIHLQEGEHLFRQGETGKAIYLVVEGELAVFLPKMAHSGKPYLINLLGEGELVGEMALLFDVPRTADVVANKESVVLRFDQCELLQELANNPEIEKQVRREATIRQYLLWLIQSPVFAQVPLELLRHLATQCEEQSFQPLQNLAVSGMPISHIGLLATGHAKAFFDDYRGNSHIHRALHPGALIGALALMPESDIESRVHISDIVATEGGMLLTIPLSIMRQLMLSYPPILHTLLMQAERGFSETINSVSLQT